MKKTLILILIVMLTFSLLTTCKLGKTTVTSETTIISLDKNQLVNEATIIIEGKVISSEIKNDYKGFPATDYKIKVDKVFKGEPVPEVVVRTAGGENSEMIYIPDDGMVSFEIGEKVILFLTNDKGNRPDKDDFGYFVVGQFQGKFKEENGKLKNDKFVFDASTFKEELKKIEEENKAKGLKKIKAESDSDI